MASLEEMMQSLSLGAYDGLFRGLREGTLGDFESACLQLEKEFNVRRDARNLSTETMRSVYVIAHDLENICQTLLEFAFAPDSGTKKLLSGVDHALASTQRPPPPPKDAAAQYIPSAYHWLLQNLHNPYPSVAIREDLAKRTGCPRSHIDDWFTGARRRMGWNRLRQSHFASRKEMVDAATRCYGRDPDRRGGDPQYEALFVEIKDLATQMYTPKLEPSQFAKELGKQIVSATDELNKKAAERKQALREKNKAVKKANRLAKRKEQAAEKKQQAEIQAVLAAKRSAMKARQRAASEESVDSRLSAESEDPVDRPRLKRGRGDSEDRDFTAESEEGPRRSKRARTTDDDDDSDYLPSPPPPSRKRRVSDSNALEPPTKRWKNTYHAGRSLRSVSDPNLPAAVQEDYERPYSPPALSSSSSRSSSPDELQTPPPSPKINPLTARYKTKTGDLGPSWNPDTFADWFPKIAPHLDIDTPRGRERIAPDGIRVELATHIKPEYFGLQRMYPYPVLGPTATIYVKHPLPGQIIPPEPAAAAEEKSKQVDNKDKENDDEAEKQAELQRQKDAVMALTQLKEQARVEQPAPIVVVN